MSDPTASANDEVAATGGCFDDDVFQSASQGAMSEDQVVDSTLVNDPVIPERADRHCVRSSTSYYSLTGSDSCLVGSIPASPSSMGNSSDVSKDQMFSFLQETGSMEQSLIKDALKAENEFIHYALSFPKKTTENNHSADSKKSSTEVSPKVGLDHLDNLCKLMEQLSELKEANVKLKRKVQYLEDLKALHEIHREMLHLSASRDPSVKGPHLSVGLHDDDENDERISAKDQSTDSRSSADRLQRSKTTTHVNTKADHAKHEHNHRSRSATKDVNRERSKSVGHPDHSKNKNRSSRWSKVKAVLGIEKADAQQQQHNVQVGQMQLLPSKGETKEKKSGGVDMERSSPRLRGSSSVHSRNRNRHSTVVADEQEEREILRNPSTGNIRADQWNEGLKKYSKTTWGKMKTIIQSRRGDSRSQRTESGFTTSKSYTDVCAEVSIPEQQSLKRPVRASRKTSFGSKDSLKHCSDKDPQNKSNTLHVCDRVADRSAAKQKSTSPSRKTTEDRSSSKKTGDFEAGPNKSMKPSTRNDLIKESQADIPNRNKASKNDVECCQSELKHSSSNPKDDKSIQKTTSHQQKETASVSPQANSTTEDIAKGKELPTPVSCTSATVTELLKELQQNLSDDFNKKLEEWHRVRSEGSKQASSEMERKDSFGRLRKFSRPDKIKPPATEKLTKHSSIVQKKDLHWLEKELQKVEREIIRLSKEKQKFEKRALRLMCLKEAMQESQMKNNEVFVKTAAGEFRFEGISNAFTKKLYEWETKKGVGPELSTIVLLDESLKTQDFQPRECKSITDIDKRSLLPSNSELLTDRFVAYRISKSSSEPDFSSLSNSATKDSESPKSAVRCQSGETFLSFGNDSQVSSTSRKDGAIEKCGDEISRDENSTELQHSREDYCSLLEENIFLLDQLKDKEHVCAKLQTELDRLDEKAGKANLMHKEELEKYRQKLWEIHMSRPKDLQGSLQLISELKTRIEELHRCSDKLKSDREKLEESFRRNNEQQKSLSDDLINRILDMQERLAESAQRHCGNYGSRRKCRKHCRCGAIGMAKIHEISAKLLKQARDMEEALAEKTRQVCHLRWELLLRDMSTVLLQAALHRVTYQRPQATLLPTWDVKRMKFKAIKAWSIDSTERRQSEVTIAEDWLQERLKQLSITPYKQWVDDVHFDNSGLIGTVHDLEKEVISIESCDAAHSADSTNLDGVVNCSAESEAADSDRNYDSGSVLNSRSSSFSSPEIRESCSDTRLYQRSRSLSIHRNSSSSMSCVSGFEASESSSMHDSDKIQNFMRKRCLPLKTRRTNRWSSKENVSSSCSSRSSIHDGDVSNRTRSYMEDEDEDDDEPRGNIYASGGQHDAQYIRMIEAENMADRDFERKSWSNQCLITPRRMHIMPHVQPECSYASTASYALDAQRSHANKTQKHQADIDCDVFFSSEESDTNTHEEPGENGSESVQQRDGDQFGMSTTGNCRPPPPPLAVAAAYANSRVAGHDRYSASDGRASFMTEKEYKLLTDIGGLANSCQSPFDSSDHHREGYNLRRSSAIQARNGNPLNLDPATQGTSAEGATITYENPSNAFTYKYKGTQGFGRKPKSLYRDGIL